MHKPGGSPCVRGNPHLDEVVRVERGAPPACAGSWFPSGPGGAGHERSPACAGSPHWGYHRIRRSRGRSPLGRGSRSPSAHRGWGRGRGRGLFPCAGRCQPGGRSPREWGLRVNSFGKFCGFPLPAFVKLGNWPRKAAFGVSAPDGFNRLRLLPKKPEFLSFRRDRAAFSGISLDRRVRR